MGVALLLAATTLGALLPPRRHHATGPARPHTVLVVGAGIGGASTAYYLRGAAASVTVAERLPRIGGRLLSTTFHGSRVNLGGDAWADANEYMLELRRYLARRTGSVV